MKQSAVRKYLAAIITVVCAMTCATPIAHADGTSPENELFTVVLVQDDERMVSSDIPAQYVQEYKNRLKNEKFKAAEIAKATGSEISLMTTTANNPLKPTVTYFRKKQLLHAIHMAGGLSYLNVTNGLFMIAIIVFAGLLGLLLGMMMRRQRTREQAHERMLERERQEHHAQTLDYATQVHDSGGRGIR